MQSQLSSTEKWLRYRLESTSDSYFRSSIDLVQAARRTGSESLRQIVSIRSEFRIVPLRERQQVSSQQNAQRTQGATCVFGNRPFNTVSSPYKFATNRQRTNIQHIASLHIVSLYCFRRLYNYTIGRLRRHLQTLDCSANAVDGSYKIFDSLMEQAKITW